MLCKHTRGPPDQPGGGGSSEGRLRRGNVMRQILENEMEVLFNSRQPHSKEDYLMDNNSRTEPGVGFMRKDFIEIIYARIKIF